MEYYLGKDSIHCPSPNKKNKYYDRLCGFEYIGVKYYSYENNDNINDINDNMDATASASALVDTDTNTK